MATVDMQAWYQENSSKLSDLKEQFIDAMLEDESFFWLWGNKVVQKHVLKWKPSQLINLKPIDDLIVEINNADFTLPTKPAGLQNLQIDKFRTHVFDDKRLDKMESLLNGIYSNFSVPGAYDFNGQPLREQIQAAFYDYQYLRDREVVIDQIDTLANEWAADGYTHAPGALAYGVSQVVNDHDRRRTDATAGVFKELAQHAQQNIQWAFENGIGIEELHMDFAIKYSELSKVFIQTLVDAYICEIDKRIDEQRTSLLYLDELTKGISLDLEADIKKYELELKERGARLGAYIQATNTYIEAEAGKIVEQLKLATNISEGYGGIFASYGSMFTGISYEE